MGEILERRGIFWGVALWIAVLFAVTNLPWHLDDYDQAKQAFTSFEMVQTGHWFHQHTPNEKIATKPPLVGWISAAIFGVTRSWEVAWRLPSIAAALCLMLILAGAATRAFGGAAGLLAMSAFGLHMMAPRLATLVRTDMPLALVVFLIGLQIWRKTREGAEPWQPRDRLVAFALLTGAMLIKGPIVWAFLLPGIAAFQWLRRDRSVSAWCGWWPWVASLGVFLLWVAAGVAWMPGFYEQVVLREFAGRFSETVHRAQPFYFYLPHLLHKFAPWSVVLLVFAVVGWRRSSGRLAERWRGLSPDVAWLVCWSLGGLVVMSFIPSKRVDRIFPIVPPLCLLLAAQYAGLVRSETVGKRVRNLTLGVLAAAAVVLTAYTAVKVVGAFRADERALVRFGAAVRSEAAARGWRYEVVGGKDEGLLLYLRKTHFAKAGEVVAQWNAGALDALVVPADELPGLLNELPGGSVSALEATVSSSGRGRRYVWLTR